MKTAVEILIEKIESTGIRISKAEKSFVLGIEKKQIVDAWRNGDNDSAHDPSELDKHAEQYYNETYGNESK